MKNAAGTTCPVPSGLGPLPTAQPDARPARSSSRSALLETLRAAPDPVSLAELSAGIGRHPNTVRGHLQALVRAGLVRRRPAPPDGRGRPAGLYAAERAAAPAASPYAGLAATLARSITRSSDSAREDAIGAGEEWGRELARNRGRSATPAEARRQVVGLLADLGFGPEPAPEGNVVRLTRCPLLGAAQQSPDVVCGVHLGLVRGALAVSNVDPAGADLFPFAEPGACRLELAGLAAQDRR